MTEEEFLTSNKQLPRVREEASLEASSFLKRNRRLWLEKPFKLLLVLSGLFILFIIAGLVLSLFVGSLPSLKQFGLNFMIETTWDPAQEKFGAFAFIVGTVLVAGLALLISLPFSLALGIFLGEYHVHGIWAGLMRTILELLAGIPSVIYGLVGIALLVPVIQQIQLELGFIPYGVSILSASLTLAIMIIPYTASLSKEVLHLVPLELKEAAYALGATRQEVLTQISLPYAASGISAGVILALGRGLGETIAVTMLIGNVNILPENLFSPGQTIASLIANQFNEANNELHRAAMLELGLILLVITVVVNILGRLLSKKMFAQG